MKKGSPALPKNKERMSESNYKNIFIGIISCLVDATLDAVKGFISSESSLSKIIQLFNLDLAKQKVKGEVRNKKEEKKHIQKLEKSRQPVRNQCESFLESPWMEK